MARREWEWGWEDISYSISYLPKNDTLPLMPIFPTSVEKYLLARLGKDGLGRFSLWPLFYFF